MNARRPSNLEFARAAAEAHRAMNLLKQPAVECATVAGAYVAALPGAGGEYPSDNPNCVDIVGDRGSVTPEALDGVIGFYRGLGVPRFFVFIAPDSENEASPGFLAERGFSRWPWTEYPTLVRPCGDVPEAPTTLEVRLATGADAVHREALEAIYGNAKSAAGFVRTLGRPELGNFLAFSGERPVAAGFLRVRGAYGYLGSAATHPEFRGRGAQSALIAARVRRATELGCSWCISETLTMLTTSLGNLRRAGFEEAFRWNVYGWGLAG